MSDEDREVLTFAAAQPVILVAHVALLLGLDVDVARERLERLKTAGLLVHSRVSTAEPGCYQITPAGLDAIGSELPPRRLDLGRYRRDVGVAWLWLGAAKGGTFGPIERFLSEREMRAPRCGA